MRKYIVALLSVIAGVLILSSILLIGCTSIEEPIKDNLSFEKTNLETMVAVTASNLVVGQSTDESELGGEFSVEGELSFSDEPQTVTAIGAIELNWIFTPTATTKYNTVEGSVTIEVYNFKLIFEENGDTECILFGDTFKRCYSLKNVTLGNRIKKLSGEFIDCDGLESITIPESVEEIGHSTFMWCTSLKSVNIEGNSLKNVGDYAFTKCLSLQEIKFPEITRISPVAFWGASSLENIEITDEQIASIASDLHQRFIGDASDFKVNITRGEQYGGTNFSGEYLAETEEINLYIDKFSIYALNALSHEFFHHYQYVLQYGVNDETFYTVTVCNDSFVSFDMYGNMPVYIVANPDYNYIGSVNYYERKAGSFLNGTAYILIDSDYIDQNWGNYIQLMPDGSNYEEYWDQTYEKDARTFAYYISGISYDQD